MSAGEVKHGNSPKQSARLPQGSMEEKLSVPSSHDLKNKSSISIDSGGSKKPFLKKRSGLFRFYKCLPGKSLPPHMGRTERLFMEKQQKRLQQRNLGCDSPHIHARLKGNLKTQSMSLIHRSMTYNMSNDDLIAGKLGTATVSRKPTRDDEQFTDINEEIVGTDNGTEKYRDTAPVSSRFNLNLSSDSIVQEQGDVKRGGFSKLFPELGLVNLDYYPDDRTHGKMEINRNKTNPDSELLVQTESKETTISTNSSLNLSSGEQVASKTTYPNGDVEIIYANGTRELTKKDKSEIRHIYRNGDIRTLSSDGTVAYFYAQSSTWQTTYSTGMELFKFPNGVTERRFPNGFVEQADTEGRVTLFQSKQMPYPTPNPNLSRIQLQDAIPPPTSINFVPATTFPAGPIQPVRVFQPSGLDNKYPVIGAPRNKQIIPRPGVKLGAGEHIVVFENGEEEIHGVDYRKRIFPDGTVKTVYKDGSHETRYPNGRIRIKDGKGNLVADVTVAPTVAGAHNVHNFPCFPRKQLNTSECKMGMHVQNRQQNDVT